MNEKQLAEKIVELVGGEGNIVSVRHCVTRLRIVVSDKDKIETDAVEALDRVKGSFFNSGQYQIILGTGLVNRVYDEVIKITGGAESGEKKETVVYGNRFRERSACSRMCSSRSWFFGFREENRNTDGAASQKTETKQEPVKVLKAFVSGKVIPITEVADSVFSSKALGDGVAIEPSGQTITAPCDGTISMIAEGSNHAIGMTLNNGAELLLHIGLDTVSLNGEGFEVLVQADEEVKEGQELMRFDKKFIESRGLASTCILVLTNSDDYPDARMLSGMDAAGKETEIIRF